MARGIGIAGGIKVVNQLTLKKKRDNPEFSGWVQCSNKGP